MRTSDVIRRADGRRIRSYADEARFTTPEMLEVERRLVASVVRRNGEGAGVAIPSGIQEAIEHRPTLSPEQTHMVRRVCGSGDGVEVVEGVAGAGKTFALAAARQAWEASGYRVIGCALAARAAAELQRAAGIPSSTLDRLLVDLDRAECRGLTAGTVVVVDEAAMIGTRKLARLVAHAEVGGAKVVLVGDRRQLPDIDAGGAFAGIADRLGATHLDENRRQHHQWERDALAELRVGVPDAGPQDL